MTKEQTAELARRLHKALRQAEIDLEEQALDNVIQSGVPLRGIPGALMLIMLGMMEAERLKKGSEARRLIREYFAEVNAVLTEAGQEPIPDEWVDEAIHELLEKREEEEQASRPAPSRPSESGGGYNLSHRSLDKLPVN